MDTLRERLVVLCTTHRLESVRVRDGDDGEIAELKRMRMRRMESRDDDVRRRATTCDVRQNQGSGEIGRRRVGMGIPKRRVRQGRSISLQGIPPGSSWYCMDFSVFTKSQVPILHVFGFSRPTGVSSR